MLSICVMSDLHGYLPKIKPCELVLICGDTISLGAQGYPKSCFEWYRDVFKPWAESLPCDKVLFIAGNHEKGMEGYEEDYKSLFPFDGKVSFLFHEEYVYTSLDSKEYRIFGTPYCKIFGDWAFMLPEQELKNKFMEIPEGLDILITHDQPYKYGDVLLQKDCWWADGKHIGNAILTEAILKSKPKYQFNGHLHSCDHSEIDIEGTKHYNVSFKNEDYRIVYEPLYLNIGNE